MNNFFKSSIFIFCAFVLFNQNLNFASATCCDNPKTNCAANTCVNTQGAGWQCLTFTSSSHPELYDTVSCLCPGGNEVLCSREKVAGSSTAGGTTGGLLPAPTGPPVTAGCDSSKQNCGNYSLNDFIQIAVLVSKYILSIVGALALLMFIYAGFTMLLSAGSQEKVTKARGILIGAVIGLVIVFASYMIIGFILDSVGFDNPNGGSWATAPK